MYALLEKYQTVQKANVRKWHKVGRVEDFPVNAGACVKINDQQIAVFHFARKGKWYATQNLCPHKFEMVLSRGMIGDQQGLAKLACPLHKKTFSLESGENLNGDLPPIATFPVKVSEGFVYIGMGH